ncbi:MAG: hypothetical protein KDK70_15310 [Myxococcales bacterium]|nr:hypothetical protein [Myxococcales bacterium]
MPSFDSHAALRPTRALLHPLWLGSLAVLVLNDHVLKGAGALPEALTGKLSDFAGLVVAPALLAALCRVQTRRGWWLAHLAVGVVFSAIQLSTSAAAGWSTLMGAVGFPWLITMDPTDLWALPALGLSAWALRPAMQRPVVGAARRSAELTAAGTGLVCCAATSPAPGEPFVPDINTDVYVHNASDEPVVVRLRELSPSVDLDCYAVAEDPSRLITEPLFGQSESFLLDPDQNFGLVRNDSWFWEEEPELDEPTTRDCTAVLLDVDGMPSAVVFWRNDQIPVHTVPGLGAEESGGRGRIEIHPSGDPDTLGEYVLGDDEILHLVPPATPPEVGACAPQSDAGRLYWSEPVPSGAWEVVAIESGADGCYALDLGISNPVGETVQSNRWYICAPLSHLGLEPGRLVDISPLAQGTGDGGGVLVSTAEETSDSGLPLVQLQAYRGTSFPAFHGLQVAAVPAFNCGYAVAPTCGTITRGTSVTAGGDAFGVVALQPGERQTLAGDGQAEMTVALAHAEERAALDPECAEGPDTLGLDLEVVALYIEPPL